jgi:uncharacterized repeat protein (TIGR03803 family)
MRGHIALLIRNASLALCAATALASCSAHDSGSASSIPAISHGDAARGSAVRPHATYAYEVLYTFPNTGGTNYAKGESPAAPLLAVGKTLYGTTTAGGAPCSCGTVFSLTLGHPVKERTLYAFKGGSDAAKPVSAFVYLSGALYGVSLQGGTSGIGAVYKVDVRTGHESVIHSFNGFAGATPVGSLTAYKGKLYGTTAGGGSANQGTVFEMTPSGAFHAIYNFGTVANDGNGPNGSLIVARPNTFYGTTSAGGAYNDGTVFTVTTSGAERIANNFTTSSNAYGNPQSGLVILDGYLFGTLTAGGSRGAGALFGYDISNPSSVPSYAPFGSMQTSASVPAILDKHLYLTATEPTSKGFGIIYDAGSATAPGLTVAFNYPRNGSKGLLAPSAGVIAFDGSLYGVALETAPDDGGGVFRLTPVANAANVGRSSQQLAH